MKRLVTPQKSSAILLMALISCLSLNACRAKDRALTSGLTSPDSAQPGLAPATPEGATEPGETSLPFDAPGPYHLGLRKMNSVDERRGRRQVAISFWYPAVAGPDPDNYEPVDDAEPDLAGAPYPLILSSTKVAKVFARYLVSRGFTWVSIDGIDTYERWNEQMIEQPQDILFALEQAATNPPQALIGLIDVDRAGAIGYSFDGYNALSLSGTRVNPGFYLERCSDAAENTEDLVPPFDQAYHCGPALEWDAFAASASAVAPMSGDGLWLPLSDDRIRAVMPLAAEGWWLYGSQGLSAADRPALFLVGSQDELYQENLVIYEHFGSPDKGLITFINRSHMMIYDRAIIKKIAHFAVAFFGYHLQGIQEMAFYFSEAFVEQQAGLAWGAYARN